MSVDTDFGSFPEKFAKYVRATRMVDFDVADVKKQANDLKKGCNTLLQAVRAAHEFVAAMPLGFDAETKPASYILKKSRGQCNTKTTLIIALLRAMGVPTRVHVWRIYKKAHKGHMNGLVHFFTPKTTVFTYPEIYYKNEWKLMSELIREKGDPNWDSCPFDDAARRDHPLKKEWIAQDLGSFWHPDDVWKKLGTNSKGWRKPFFPIAQLFLN